MVNSAFFSVRGTTSVDSLLRWTIGTIARVFEEAPPMAALSEGDGLSFEGIFASLPERDGSGFEGIFASLLGGDRSGFEGIFASFPEGDRSGFIFADDAESAGCFKDDSLEFGP
jgi:hypothetical protein